MTAAVHCFAADHLAAQGLASALGVPCHLVEIHEFPDGETLPNVVACSGVVIAYCPLNRPNAKLVNLLLACDAWRRAGAARLVLVAPYMSHLRQDAVFLPGQALSRDVVGRLLGERFDHVVTVEPHLHRTADLAAVFAPATLEVLSAGQALAQAIGPQGAPLVVGPDVESEPWARGVAERLGASHVTLRKERRGDLRVDLVAPDDLDVRGRRVVLVDDICSSGGTLEAATILLSALGAACVEVAVVHALFDAEAAERLAQAGVIRVVSTNSCPHPTNAADLAPQLAAALTEEIHR